MTQVAPVSIRVPEAVASRELCTGSIPMLQLVKVCFSLVFIFPLLPLLLSLPFLLMTAIDTQVLGEKKDPEFLPISLILAQPTPNTSLISLISG